LSSVAFPYTNYEAAERLRKQFQTNSIYNCTKNNKIPRNKLNEEVKDLYSGNYKTLMKEIENNTKKWKDVPCSWIARTNIVKIFILPKAV